jgi:ABC-2 type transport system ATP-binding protein
VITVDNLSKAYGQHFAVKDVSFTCRPGTVTGFLGPNGAGKSTTMRVICGLTRPSAGHAAVSGVPYHQLANPGREVGVLLDASAQHAGRTGREVLSVSAMIIGAGTRRVEHMLDLVGLSGKAAKRRVRDYSLGMRQRLGLAHALLGEPSVLILDEPANGLDPEGIHWMRGLLREFADGGGTVLLSSHLLREVEVVADHLVLIRKGSIVAQGHKDELLTSSGIFARGLDAVTLGEALTRAGLPATRVDANSFVVDADAESVGRAAAAGGVVLIELRSSDNGGIEELFLSMTSDDVAEEH